MKKVFLTFGDGAANFAAARDRVVREAQATGIFDEVVGGDWSAASEEMARSVLRREPRGCGYWAWKPDLVWQTLKRLAEGDVLVYSDGGNVVHRAHGQWQRLWQTLATKDLVVRREMGCAFKWIRRELLEAFADDLPAGPCLCRVFEANLIAIRKTPFTMRLVEEWRDVMLRRPELVRDVEVGDRQLPSFVQNRHDQAVWTLLVSKYLARPETREKIATSWDFHFGWWPLGNPVVTVARHRGGESCRITFKRRLSRAVFRTIWMVRDWFERRGVQVCWIR